MRVGGMEKEMEQFKETELYDIVEGLGGVPGGTHVCFLDDPVHLEMASSGLCELVGYSPDEIKNELGSSYSRLLHPDDVPAFRRFVRALSAEEGVNIVSYRFLSKDGRTIPAVDTMISRRLDDGHMWGFSVVRDVSGGSHGSSGEDASNVADVPLHGMLRVRLGENPCVVSADDDMLVVLGFDKSEVSRSHESLIQALNAAFLPLISQLVAGLSGSGRARIQMRRQVIRRVDGTFANIVKWGTLEGSADGGTCQLFVVLDSDEEVCDDSGGMLEGLEQFVRDSADMIFLLEMRKGSLTCIKDEFPELPSIPMGFPLVAQDVAERWVQSYVCAEDQKKVLGLFDSDALVSGDHIFHEKATLQAVDSPIPVSILAIRDGSRVLVLVKNANVDRRTREQPAEQSVLIRTFGRFEVFRDGKPIVFKSKKAKEYLALLVNARGSFVSSREAVLALWPDSTLGENDYARARKAAMNMGRTLEREGIASIVEKDGSSRRIVPSKVSCDLFDFLEDPERNSDSFRGSYLPEYEWGEITLAELTFSLYD